MTTEPITIDSLVERNERPTFYSPIGASRVSDQGFLAIQLEEYLKLLDQIGRQIRSDKRGSIPKWLPLILERIGISDEQWFDRLIDRFDSTPNIRNLPHA